VLDHVFTDAISALHEAFEGAFLERQAFEERFQSDILAGGITWETSYGLPGEGVVPRVVAHLALEWSTFSQSAYRSWLLDETSEERPSIGLEISFRVQRLASQPRLEQVRSVLPTESTKVGEGTLERAGITLEAVFDESDEPSTSETPDEWAVEGTYEGVYVLGEDTLADGASTSLDEHFGALGGWIAAILVRLGDIELEYLPSDDAKENP